MLSRELLLDFFLTFSRFEFGLKASGFVNAEGVRAVAPIPAKPDWDSFSDSIQESFQTEHSPELADACRYLLSDPPRRQVVWRQNVFWETQARGGDSEVRYLLRLVRSIRNNLFHGGKYDIEVHEDELRTERLLMSGLVVQRECSRLSERVRVAFDAAVL